MRPPKICKFVQEFDEEIPPKTNSADEGEKWRCVEPGVCFEGFCLNGKCDACYNKGIGNFGFGICDLCRFEAYRSSCLPSAF